MRVGQSMLVAVVGAIGGATICWAQAAGDYPIRPVPAHHVRFSDVFWWPRLEVNRTVTIPYSFQMCEETGRVENFKVAAGTSDKPWVGMFGFNDSDLSKIIEGASYSLMTHPDVKLSAYVDELIALMAAAQEDDGYLYTAWTARDRIADPEKALCRPTKQKWLEEAQSHELYNLGHMYEAAAAHHEAMGKRNFLDVATKSADLLVETFGDGKMEVPPGHPEVELGLVKLCRATGDRRYLDLAKYYVELRGRPTDDRPKLWGEYNQDHKPLGEQDEAVGHAVRAVYLYAGAADVAALTGDRSLIDAVDRLWDNVVGKKTYITGGVGATGKGEAFGTNYELPNRTAYCETCANLATCYWNHRMFLLHGDGKYIDVLERALYNGVISGVSLDGREFFYPNPLASHGDYARSKWFDCSCCPTNICRFIPSVPGYAYALGDDALYVNLFVEGTADLEVGGKPVRIEQKSNYPWDGRVEITVTPDTAGQQFALHVRIPGWARGDAWPSGLYGYLDKSTERPTLSVNGETIAVEPTKGYARIHRAWQPGDMVTLELPMSVRRVVANEQVAADRGRVALMRGPLVYCVEGIDVDGGNVGDLVLSDQTALATDFRRDLLGGVQVVTWTETNTVRSDSATVKLPSGDVNSVDSRLLQASPITAIPYYAWAHRGKGEMAVWLARTSETGDDQ